MSFVTSIYSALGLGLVSFRFNDKNSFSKLKKKKFRFQPCTHRRMCVYGPFAPGYHFENNSSSNNNNNNNNNNNLLQRIQQSEALHLQYLHYKSTLKKEIYQATVTTATITELTSDLQKPSVLFSTLEQKK